MSAADGRHVGSEEERSKRQAPRHENSRVPSMVRVCGTYRLPFCPECMTGRPGMSARGVQTLQK